MKPPVLHSFHIPVMGLGYTIDSPVKVARFGISSVVSIIEDNLIELMREFYCEQTGEDYHHIANTDTDHRANRITEYLNLMDRIVKAQTEKLRNESFEPGNEIIKYFELLPENSTAKILYNKMIAETDLTEKEKMQSQLRATINAGAIDVNIMTKCDRTNYDAHGDALPPEYSDAMAALRGYANSTLTSSVVFSAGLNPRLYSYCEQFKDFFPDESGNIKKKIIIKVSDYRSALVQGKIFAKKGIWVSEFRIESGLNCGGHAFATDGLLLGPILESFKENRQGMSTELFEMCNAALQQKGVTTFKKMPALRITVQGGIGTGEENAFLLDYFEVDSTGWGSPFLLVPEVTNVDTETLNQLATASKDDYYLSDASPLGVPFNNFRKASSEKQRLNRIEKNRPGSACYKKFLAFSTEFGGEPLCTASRKYQHLKMNQLKEQNLPEADFKKAVEQITVKDCLCEGLAVPALLTNQIAVPHNLEAVAICPGPNLAYFSGIFTLKQMVDHIYGRTNILNSLYRPNMFVNELNLYVDYLKKEIQKAIGPVNEKKEKQLALFKENLQSGIDYYKQLSSKFKTDAMQTVERFRTDLKECENNLKMLMQPVAIVQD